MRGKPTFSDGREIPMRPFLVLLLLFLFGGELAAQKPCPSRPARPEDIPQGANSDVVFSDLVYFSQRIHGKVLNEADSPLPHEVVIAIFRLQRKENGISGFETTLRNSRLRAFLIAPDGSYCITGLQPGRYLLQVGTNGFHGFQAVYLTIHVRKRSARVPRRVKFNFTLPVGT